MESAAPIVNSLNRPFWDAAAAGDLVLPHCLESGRAFWPPSPISPYGAGPVRWRPVEPFGTVATIVTYHRPFQQAFADRLPYAVALVELSAGPRLPAHVEDPSTLAAGASVRLVFRTLFADGFPLVVAIPHNPSKQE